MTKEKKLDEQSKEENKEVELEVETEELQEPAKVVEPEVEKVSISKETLERILSQLDKNTEQMAILRESVSSSKLTQAENKRKPDQLPKAYLKVFQGKLVVSWKSEKAEMIFHPLNPNVPTGEILKATYYFQDGTDSGVIDQVLFTRCEDRAVVRILEGINALKNPDHVNLKVRFEELITSDDSVRANFVAPIEDFEVNRNFINP